MLLGGSGDALLMKLCRHYAKRKGMTLNEYGMGDKWARTDQVSTRHSPGPRHTSIDRHGESRTEPEWPVGFCSW